MQQSQLHDQTTSCHAGQHCTVEHKESAIEHNTQFITGVILLSCYTRACFITML